eukprot:SAG31_NODE_699_length_12741_cov_5.762617_2_plen_137_part_00
MCAQLPHTVQKNTRTQNSRDLPSAAAARLARSDIVQSYNSRRAERAAVEQQIEQNVAEQQRARSHQQMLVQIERTDRSEPAYYSAWPLVFPQHRVCCHARIMLAILCYVCPLQVVGPVRSLSFCSLRPIELSTQQQ